MWKVRGYSRFLIRCWFDEEGIHGKGPRLGDFDILWNHIRTYGIVVSSCSYLSLGLTYVSTVQEYAPKDVGEATKISQNRLIFQYRKDFWAAFTEYMPADMQKHLNVSISSGCNGHYQRRTESAQVT